MFAEMASAFASVASAGETKATIANPAAAEVRIFRRIASIGFNSDAGDVLKT